MAEHPKTPVPTASLLVAVAVAVAVAVGACGSASNTTTTRTPSTAATTAAPSTAVADEHELERAINAGAEARLATYHPRNGPYPMTTQCKPTTPDLDNWSCVTTVQSPAALGTVACQISTDVTSQSGNFRWSTPDPLLSPTAECDQLAGNIGGP